MTAENGRYRQCLFILVCTLFFGGISALVIVGVVVIPEYNASKAYQEGAVCRITDMNYSTYTMPCLRCMGRGRRAVCYPSSYPCLVVNVTYTVTGGNSSSAHDAQIYRYALQDHNVSETQNV